MWECSYIAVTRGCNIIFTLHKVAVFLDTCTQKCMAQFSVHVRRTSDRINHIKPEGTVYCVCVPSDAYYKQRSRRHFLRSKKRKNAVCEDHVRLFVRPSVTWRYRLNRLSQSSNSVWQFLSHRETSSRASFVKIGSEIVRLPLRASVNFCPCLKHKLSNLHEIQYNRSAQNAVGHL